MIKKEIIVEKNQKILNLLQDYGFSFVDSNKILKNKDVKINSKAVKNNIEVQVGDSVVFYYSEKLAEKRFDVLFEDEDVCVVYKYSGVETAGEKGLENLIGGVIAVHRLDRNTEGLVVFAKNRAAEAKLLKAFKEKTVQKFYVAEVSGEFDCEKTTFKAYLSKDAEKSLVSISKKQTSGAVEVLTSIKTLRAGVQSSLVEVELLTGKTHQIRAHLAFLGHPILGDGKYGNNEINKKFGVKRQKLACFRLKFGYLGLKSIDFKEFVKYPAWFKL